MGEKLIVGPITKGIVTNLEPFFINNDSFPVLENAYQWRGRVKRKRGTEKLTRLRRPMSSSSLGNTDGSGALSVDLISLFSLEATASIIPSSITVTITGAPDQVFTDNGSGVLSNGGSGAGTVNYVTGDLALQTDPVLAAAASVITFSYYPALPVMGLEEFKDSTTPFPGCIAFDTTYSYVINTTTPYLSYANNYYKNPPSGNINAIPYVQKTTPSSITWNGQDYQQFWSQNYQGALFVTNGFTIPFDATHIGMQYKAIASIAWVSATELTITITEASASLEIGDWVFINEVTGTDNNTVNFQTGFVTDSANAAETTTLTVRFPYANIANQAYSDGILQYLTANSDSTKDCLRWYDGSPVSSATPPVFNHTSGWVNFCPPLISGPTSSFSIADLPPGQWYLIGARSIVSFKDRLLFLGPVVQTSSAGSQKYLQDTIIYSQNGVPYYTASFDNTSSPSFGPQINYVQMLTPGFTTATSASAVTGQTAYPSSFWEDSTGYGGFLTSGYDEPLNTVTSNEDVLIIGFSNRQSRLVYTGNDLLPFVFYVINSEYGSSGAFSAINFGKGALSIGYNGVILATQNDASRIDLEIPDDVFQINLLNNGAERICAHRDFINEWIYFTYSSSNDDSISYFPDQTLFYNYRDNSWAIFYENYTTYGSFRKTSGETWDDLDYFTWDEWTDNWDSGETTLAQPEVIGGNQQGYVMVKSEEIAENPSGYIQSIDSNSLLTSPNHNLNNTDFIIITGCLGTIGTSVNGKIFSVQNPDQNSFTLDPTVPTGTYLGGGEFTRLYRPNIQTKQFPLSWSMARKTRIGVQQYLLSKTSQGQITLNIYLNQNTGNPYNTSSNDSLIYSSTLYTCPESTNLGLTAANVNLQMPTASQQAQIWHRVNTSLIGDTVQLGFTLSDDQMKSLISIGNGLNIIGATQANPCVLTCTNALAIGQLVKIENVQGMTELNNNIYIIVDQSATTLSIEVDSSAFTAYTSGGTATPVAPVYQKEEIELHSFILDVSPSGFLA